METLDQMTTLMYRLGFGAAADSRVWRRRNDNKSNLTRYRKLFRRRCLDVVPLLDVAEVLEFKVFAEMQNCDGVQSQWNSMWITHENTMSCVSTHSTLTTIIQSAISQFLRTITQAIEHVGYFFRKLVQKMY